MLIFKINAFLTHTFPYFQQVRCAELIKFANSYNFPKKVSNGF
ncbi:hypothetical protein BGAPBR_I0056 (plasmid) [Borreliella garinii PBr]|uniref:Uncharacterized protein n=1 Tax=Borreliella garinii PBr TaxID=498743 RepID=B8F135_BORGR|nr:hypothetical protein BGAPBR_I0056 [Borreliella garinii PBr]